MILLGLTGRAGSGKDTVADYLAKRYDVTRLSFAAPLKMLACKWFGFSDEQVNTLEGKETPDPRWCGPDGKPRTPREVLQLIGTEGFRAVDPDFWLKIARRSVEECAACSDEGVAFTDLRFPNEAAMIRSLGGYVVRVIKEGGTGTTHVAHASETLLDSIVADFVMRARHGEIPWLLSQADNMIMEIQRSR
jgi:hypothetical protein